MLFIALQIGLRSVAWQKVLSCWGQLSSSSLASKIPDTFLVEIMWFPQNALFKALTADPFPLTVHWKYLQWKVVVLEMTRSCLRISSVSHVTSYALMRRLIEVGWFKDQVLPVGTADMVVPLQLTEWFYGALHVTLTYAPPHWQNTSWLLSAAFTTCRDCSLYRFLCSTLCSL